MVQPVPAVNEAAAVAAVGGNAALAPVEAVVWTARTSR